MTCAQFLKHALIMQRHLFFKKKNMSIIFYETNGKKR